jgi:hypothetical protein
VVRLSQGGDSVDYEVFYYLVRNTERIIAGFFCLVKKN